jgi:cytochrome P450
VSIQTPVNTHTRQRSYIASYLFFFFSASGLLHDEVNVGPHPERFVPERYLPGGGATLSTADIAFGYGRRICPGRFMGRATDWIAIASILSAFDISPALDEHGREIIPEEIYQSGLAT